MNIGIIGAGHIGGTLARKLTKLGHTVSVANSRGPASLAALAAETGAKAVSVTDAVATTIHRSATAASLRSRAG
jgi:predicted dinucleotide-binding enzyme